MPALSAIFELGRCPHCRIDRPNLNIRYQLDTVDHEGKNKRVWNIYVCQRCGGVVTASAARDGVWANEIYPQVMSTDEAIPEPARTYLNQAIDSIHSPIGSVMLCASAVDAMLKEKKYKDGVLYKRIEKAAEDHLITNEMAEWAHEVRLDANEQRHADEKVDLPTTEDAKRCINFVLAFAEFLFVLPSRIKSGRKSASEKDNPESSK